jgi:hypothetical protein
MNLIVNFDQNQSSLPSGFVSDVDYVANLFDSLFTANVTVTIDVGYGEINGQGLGSDDLGESEQADVSPVSYTTVRNALIAEGATGSSTLPASAPSDDTLYMASAEEKALGLIPSNSDLDGYVGFNSTPGIFSYAIGTTPPSDQYDFIGVVEHEMTEVMGRTSYLDFSGDYSLMDLFRYAAPDTRQLTTGAPSYFSVDSGVTDLNNWNNYQTGDDGDLGDWAPSAGDDSFDDVSYPGVINAVTPTDLTLMNAIGWETGASSALQFVGVGVFSGNDTAATAWQLDGQIELWSDSQGGLSTAIVANAEMGSGWNAVGLADFNGSEGILWSDGTGGQVAVWLMNGSQLAGAGIPNGQMGAEWSVVATGDFTGDGNADILWHNDTNQLAVWTIDGTTLAGLGTVNGTIGAEWHIAAQGDFFDVGRASVLWESTSGDLQDWLLSGMNVVGIDSVGQIGSDWRVAGVGVFKGISGGDQTSDIVWVDDSTNAVQIWQMEGGQITQFVTPNGHDGTSWQLDGVGDYSGSGYSELLWVDNTGATQIWQLNGAQVSVTSLASSSGTGGLGGGATDTVGQTAVAPSVAVGYGGSGGSDTIGSGDTDLVAAGQTVANPVIDGGTLELASGAAVDGTITFAAGGTLLDADQSAQPDTVVGFGEGSDYLSFSGESPASEAAVIAAAQIVNGNTVLTFPDHTSIVLAGVTHVDAGIFA